MSNASCLGLVYEEQAHNSSANIHDRCDPDWLYRKSSLGGTTANELTIEFIIVVPLVLQDLWLFLRGAGGGAPMCICDDLYNVSS